MVGIGVIAKCFKMIERIANEAVLTRIKGKQKLLLSIKVRRDKMIGNLLRHGSLIKKGGRKRLYWKSKTKD